MKQHIREVPHFPIEGVNFKDITPLLRDAEKFHQVIIEMADLLKDQKFDAFAGIESRGFIFASALAARMNKGFIPVRKAGKLPPPTHKKSYALEYGEATIEIGPGTDRIVIVDDVLATGGTLNATIELCETAGYKIDDVLVLIDLKFLNTFKFNGKAIKSLIQYE